MTDTIIFTAKKMHMKIGILFGCMLALTACGQFPQERFDRLQENIARFEQAGADKELPEEFGVLREAFAQVEQRAEAEKGKTFGSYGMLEEQMRGIEDRLDKLASTVEARHERFMSLYRKYAREVSLAIQLYGNLPKNEARNLPAETKESLRGSAQPSRMLQKLMRAETYEQRTGILAPLVEELEKINARLKERVSAETYETCVKKVEKQLQSTNLAGSPAGFPSF